MTQSTRRRVSRPCSSSATNSLSGKEPATLFIHHKIRAHNHHMDGRIYLGKIHCVHSQEEAPRRRGLSQHQEGRESWASLQQSTWGPPAPHATPAGLLTLRAHQHHGHLARVAEAAEPQEVVVHGLEADFILQAEHKHHRVHPGSKLGGTEQNYHPHLVMGEFRTLLPTHSTLPSPKQELRVKGTMGQDGGRSITWSSGGPPSSRISSR